MLWHGLVSTDAYASRPPMTLYISFLYLWVFLLECHEYSYQFISHLTPDEPPLWPHPIMNSSTQRRGLILIIFEERFTSILIGSYLIHHKLMFIYAPVSTLYHNKLQTSWIWHCCKEKFLENKFIPPLAMLVGKLWPSLWNQQIIYRYKTSYRCPGKQARIARLNPCKFITSTPCDYVNWRRNALHYLILFWSLYYFGSLKWTYKLTKNLLWLAFCSFGEPCKLQISQFSCIRLEGWLI